MLQPQSETEIAPVLADIRTIDARLDIRWNPRAVRSAAGSYTVDGKLNLPTYDGRWEVIIHLGEAEPPAVLYTLQFDGEGHGAYREVGPWLGDHLRQWDSRQVHFADEWAKVWAEHDRAEARELALDTDSAEQFLEEQYYALGGDRQWMGKGADFAAPRAPATQPE